MVATNGTDEGVLRSWLDQEYGHWAAALSMALDDAVEHLQALCFDDAWNELAADGLAEAETNERVLTLYADGLSDLFRFMRVSGAIDDELAWSALKANLRRDSIAAGAGSGAQEALDDSLYAADSVTLGAHDLYRAWARALMLFIFHYAANGPIYPGLRADEQEKLEWAYQALQPIEDHEQFHEAFTDYIEDAGVLPVASAVLAQPVVAILALERELMREARFDLTLNTALRWLIGAVERS